MKKVICIQKCRDDHNKIAEYILRDINGKLRRIKASDLKSQIKSGRLNVINLKLTADNRLISIDETPVTEVTKAALVKTIKYGYSAFVNDICNNKPTVINFANVLCKVDTALGENIGKVLITSDKNLYMGDKNNGYFHLEDIMLDITKREVYNALEKSLQMTANDYQFDILLEELVSEINRSKGTRHKQ